MTAKWEAGKTYVPGSLVTPVTAPTVVGGQPANGSFESGSSNWTLPTGYSVTTGNAYEGTHSLQYDGTGPASAVSTDQRAVTPGQRITASVMVQQGASGSGKAGAAALLLWYDASHASISYNAGNTVSSGSGGKWSKSSVTAAAPANAAYVAVGVSCSKNSSHSMWVDQVQWDYSYFTPAGGLVYKAVQPAPGKSGSGEPAWPPVLGQQVIDNQVIWEAVTASQIVWTARPINRSGTVEPVWPTQVSGAVHDGSIDWLAITPVVTDPNCPQSKQVAIAAAKVYSGDKDITRYCATYNPLDWTTPEDAGFIAHGLQSVQEPNCTALAVYRGNLAILTASNLQLWKADPDPAAILILDSVESVGTNYARGSVPVAQDVFFISQQGVRSISVSASQQAMGEGDVGNPVDPLVRDLLGADSDPVAVFFPNLGHSLFFFGNQALVLFQNKLAKITGWALYALPIEVTDAATLDGDLYVRDATDIYWMDQGANADFSGAFPVVLEWQYLDFGRTNSRKTFMGVSQESDATGTVSAAYAIQDTERRTGEKRLPRKGSDAFMTMSFVAKHASFRLTYDSAEIESFTRMTVYFQDGGVN